MNIIEQVYKWNGSLTNRSKTKYIILHHRGGDGDVQSIHKVHLTNGWTGIGYHFYVRKDGTVYRGRPLYATGAHCEGFNSNSVGICFEGNFQNETMSDKQIKSGKELVSYLKNLYPQPIEVKKHEDFNSTLCPGKNFPFDEIKKGVQEMTLDKAIEIVKTKAGLEQKTIDFMLCYKYGEELIKKLAKAMEG